MENEEKRNELCARLAEYSNLSIAEIKEKTAHIPLFYISLVLQLMESQQAEKTAKLFREMAPDIQSFEEFLKKAFN